MSRWSSFAPSANPAEIPRGRTITVAYFGIAGEDWQQVQRG